MPLPHDKYFLSLADPCALPAAPGIFLRKRNAPGLPGASIAAPWSILPSSADQRSIGRVSWRWPHGSDSGTDGFTEI